MNKKLRFNNLNLFQEACADWKHAEDCLVLVGGHSTNVTLVGNFCGKNDHGFPIFSVRSVFTVEEAAGKDAANGAAHLLEEASEVNKPALLPKNAPDMRGKAAPPTVDPRTGQPVGRFITDNKGNVLIEPAGGRTVAAGKGGVDTHTLYPNGSNYQRLNPKGHDNNPNPHGHGHQPGTGPGKNGQGPSLDPQGNVVPFNSKDAHWPIH